MEINPKPPTRKGPAETFTGNVWLDAIYMGEEPSSARVNIVRFSPGAHTAWHSHALGQTLFVTDGVGLVQRRGDEIVTMHAGDIVRAPADEEHWHGATPDHFMTHFSIAEGETSWGVHVSDDEYRGQPG
jgi:quercetin dioxygenase-like cupin family protein